MPEVFSEENKNYYKTAAKSFVGENNVNAVLTDEEVIKIRNRFVNETVAEIYEDYKDLYATKKNFEKIVMGPSYKHLPIYRKKR